MERLPQEMYDLITFHVEDPSYNTVLTIDPITFEEDYPTKQSRERLQNLRLVNEKFNRSATIRLFRSVCIMAWFTGPTLPASPRCLCSVRIVALSLSRHARWVRRLIVACGDLEQPDLGEEIGRWWYSGLATWFPRIMCSFKSLRSIAIYQVPRLGGPEFYPNINTQVIADLLNYLPINAQKDVLICFDRPYDLAILLNGPGLTTLYSKMTSMLKTAKQLHIRVFRGDRLPTFDCQELSIIVAFPENGFQEHELGVVHATETLQSLVIECDSIRDIDLLDSQHLHMLGKLALDGVKFSLDWFLALTQKTRLLRRLWLDEVQLKSGAWADALFGLCSLAKLTLADVRILRYSQEWEPGASGWVSDVGHLLPATNEQEAEENEQNRTLNALRLLKDQIAANRRREYLP